MTAPVVFDEASLYGLASTDCEFCLSTHKPGVCVGTRHAGTAMAAAPGQRPHIAVPTAPQAKGAQQVAADQQQDATYRAAYEAAQGEAQALNGDHRHAAVQGAMRDYARAASVHGRAVAADNAARSRLQAAHDTAVKQNQVIDQSNVIARQAAAARAAAQTAHAALVARKQALHQAAAAHQRHRPHHSIEVDESSLYGLGELELYGLLASAHWWCAINEFCRNPLHPGPCKGWKHTLHAVAPGAYHAYEKARVAKLNERRRAKVAALQAQGKRVPARLLKEITYTAPGAAQAQPGFTPPTPAQAKTVVSDIAAKVKTNVPARAAQLTDQKLAAQAQSLHDVVTAIQGRTNVPASSVKDALAKAKAAQKPGAPITEHQSIQNAINGLVGNLDGRTQGGLDTARKDQLRKDITEHVENGTPGVPSSVQGTLDDIKKAGAPAPSVAPSSVSPTARAKAQAMISQGAAPSGPAVPLAPSSSAAARLAHATANRTAPRSHLAKQHLDSYGQLSKAEFDALPSDTQRKIVGDLATARSKFLDPKKVKEAQDLLDRFGTPAAPTAPALPTAPTVPGAGVPAHVQDALDAADRIGKQPRSIAVKALTGLSKADFNSLGKDDQRKILDALHHYHIDQQSNNMSVQDQQVEKAFQEYIGQHPALHRLKQAETDFRAGKIDSAKVRSEFIHARVQAPSAYGKTDTPGAHLAKEARRVAEDNPTLTPWVRSEMIEVPYGKGGSAYHSAIMTQLRSNWDDAPRMSNNDMTDLFAATEDDLKTLHPVHQQAVRDLREHVVTTGLAAGSPWSQSTRNHLVDNMLHVGPMDSDVPPARLKEFDALSDAARTTIKKQLRERVSQATDDHDKTRHLYTLAQVNHTPISDSQRDAIKAAANRYPNTGYVNSYRKLDPKEFDSLAGPIQGAILDHLHEIHKREAGGGPVRTFQPTEDPLTVMPDALAAHLAGTRLTYPSRNAQLASDIAEYGRDIINPKDRLDRYAYMGPSGFSNLDIGTQRAVDSDLDRIAGNPSYGLPLRYGAQFTKDFALGNGRPAHINLHQDVAIEAADPTLPVDHTRLGSALSQLSKADYDSLDKAYRDAIDESTKALPSLVGQSLTAKFHPNIAPVTPAGYAPTMSTPSTPVPPHVQTALDTIYGVHPKAHTMAHQLSTYGALRGSDFNHLNAQEQGHLLGDLSFIATTAKGPSGDKARKLIDRFTPPGTPSGQIPTPAIVPPANAVPGQVRYATPMSNTLALAKDKGRPGDGWTRTSTGQQVWGKYGAAGLLLMHQDPATGERRYLMVQRGPAISDPGKWQFPGGAIDEKETFHEGGAREVIEELGFDKDSLKTAKVHGEHTHSIPGSSWKYVSIAAEVPHMLKPDLSTHHARAETSDAKWMTEDEIRKLDSSGKLLAPLAGGKLHQNVISLFSSGSATATPGPARPGAVTKRQRRLNLPATGRQAPAQFNAWPHAHKPSKGKNLLTDKSAIDKLRQDVKQARSQYDGKTADGRLAAIGAMQGFDDTPTVVSKAEVDRLLATGDYIEAWRGVKGTGGWSGRGKSAADINEEFRSGPAYYGKGVFGNGYYLATQKRIADNYSDGSRNSIIRVLIPKAAVIDTHEKMAKEAEKIAKPQSQARNQKFESGTLYDVGRYAAAKGVDGVRIDPVSYGARSMSSHHVSKKGQEAYNWINRSVLIVQEAQ